MQLNSRVEEWTWCFILEYRILLIIEVDARLGHHRLNAESAAEDMFVSPLVHKFTPSDLDEVSALA